MPSYQPRSVWGPFSTIVNVLVVLTLLPLIFTPLLLLPGSSMSFGDDPEGHLCVTASYLPMDDAPANTDYSPQIGSVEPRVDVVANRLRLCEASKGLDHKFVKYILKVLTTAPIYVVYVVFLIGVRRVMSRTDRGGPFSHEAATLLTKLGWWLFCGLIAATLVQFSAQSLLLGTMIKGETWGTAADPDFPAVMILGALGIVGVGRVLKQGAQLQDDVEGTV